VSFNCHRQPLYTTLAALAPHSRLYSSLVLHQLLPLRPRLILLSKLFNFLKLLFLLHLQLAHLPNLVLYLLRLGFLLHLRLAHLPNLVSHLLTSFKPVLILHFQAALTHLRPVNLTSASLLLPRPVDLLRLKSVNLLLT
jgi:hypothetical protein